LVRLEIRIGGIVNPQIGVLADEFWELQMEASPQTATNLGDHRYDDQLGPVTDEEIEPFLSRIRSIRERAAAIPDSDLEDAERLTRDVLLAETEDRLSLHESHVINLAISPLTGEHFGLQQNAAQTIVHDADQAAAIKRRFEQIGDHLARVARQHHADIAQGITPTAINVQRVIGQIDGYLASPIEGDPFVNVPTTTGWNGADEWREQLTAVVTEVVRPAYQAYRETLVEEILPTARASDTPGLAHLEGGDTIYRRVTKAFTSLEIDPQELHEIGLEQATEALPSEYASVGHAALGTDDLGTIFERLRNDPSLRYGTAEEMLEHARTAVTRAWEAAPPWFGRLPEAPCQVVPIPEAMAPAQPPAYYYPPAMDGSRPGTYFLNTHAPETRQRFEAEATAFHEAIPGHHFQLTLASEMSNVPMFRRHALAYAHAEGWGLYSERLADEMGLYSSDIDRLGMLSADSWRAGRLVVDTGIHHMGWTRQQAIDWLAEWTAVGMETIEQEVDRYIVLPGQALSYKVGQIEINRLRRHAESELGSAFSLPGFHDVMLTEGLMPLPALSTLVERWVGSVNLG
jgi:uncharacterized protein (DUF885 family)